MRDIRRAGFTLIELLVVIAVLAVATSIGTVVLMKTWELRDTVVVNSVLEFSASEAFQSIEDDIGAMVNSQLAGTALRGVQGEARDADNPRFFNMTFAGDSFTIPVSEPMLGGGNALAFITYRVQQIEQDGRKSWRLVRSRQMTADGAAFEQPACMADVLQMRVEYAGPGGEWTRTWNQPGNPAAVRVSLLLANPDNPTGEQIARKSVYQVRVP